MTQEEKAKAYDEALERAKEHINSKGIGDTVDLCKHLFPQLCESEDEKIRKAIIEFIKQGNINGSLRSCLGISEEQMIAYLEKQKEQKPIDYPYLPGWRKNRDNNKPELKRSVLMLTTHGVAEGEWLGEKWCQYRWSCELKDGEVLYWIHLSDLERLEKEGEEKQKEQKPAEWNKAIINGEPIPTENQSVDIPSAEWSEEDERMFSRCVKSIKSSKQFADSDTFKEAKDKEIDWLENRLKSLRPSWKPSEEQMNALNFAITHFVHYTNYKNLTELRELYEQLKKLQI